MWRVDFGTFPGTSLTKLVVPVYQACDWKKILKLTAELKKAYFSDIAQKKR